MIESKTSFATKPDAIEPTLKQPRFKASEWLQLAYNTNRSLTVLGVLMIIMLGACVIGLIFDPRLITGAPAWAKPAKFGISISFYAFTLVWLLSYVKGHPRLVGLISWATFGAFLVEAVILVVQVVRGVSSHFNIGTGFDKSLFSLMGSFVMVIWLMNLLAIILLMRQKFSDPALAWSLRLALLLTLVGASLGFLMTSHTSPAQEAALAAHQQLQSFGAHSVGVEDGGPGLPLVGWSTTGGDLRIAHFLGLHALQLLPLFGWLIMRLRYSTAHRVALVWLGAFAYLGLIALTAWQALRGQSIVAPDALTLGGLTGLIAVIGLVAGSIVLHARRHPARAEI